MEPRRFVPESGNIMEPGGVRAPGVVAMKETRPKVRQDLSLNPIVHDGQNMIVVQDPLGIIDKPLCLTEIASLLLSLMDGTRTIPEIQAVFVRVAGGNVPADFASSHAEELDKIGLLENETYQKREGNHR